MFLAQNYSYAKIAYGMVYPDSLHKWQGKEINIVYTDTLETLYILISSFPNNSEKILLLNKHDIHVDQSILKVDSDSLVVFFIFFNTINKNGSIIN